ncbi:MAG: hypothetical protein KGI38_01905 [Thaumarchaeota archaeon]|nr:hypothetical protein [Nitrososphaerota archaeon]
MRVPLDAYLQGTGAKVYSLVARVPFSPLDIDLGHLARGEWNSLTDRFRVWYLPKGDAAEEEVCYVMVRKFDPQDGVLLYGHMVVNLGRKAGLEEPWSFTVGIMSNDEIRARSMLNSMLDIPPSFHKRGEVRLVERRWRSDPEAVMRFLANVHSTMAQMIPSGKVYTLKFEPPPGMMGDLKRGMGTWWPQ